MLKPRERYFFDLLRPKEPPETLIHIKGQLRSELHERLSNPLYPIAFVMIALAFAGNVQSTRQNRAERLVLGFVVAAAVRISGFALNNLATLKAGYVPFLYLLPGLVIVFAAIMIVRGMRPRTTYSFADTVIERIEPIRRRLLPSTGRALAGPSTGDR